MPAFEKDIINVLYEADESCISQMVENWNSRPSETVVLPYCLSASDGVGKFHLNYDPYTSSIYPLNPRYAQFYYTYPARNSRPGYDYVFGDTVRTMEEVQLATTTLDAVVLERGKVPGPDFLSLDTQGSELDILNGASQLLDTTILAVQLEVELHPFYEGQPLFGDICQFLTQHNFDFVDLRQFHRKLIPMRGKQGFRGEGYTADGEALFLKRPEYVETSASGVQLNKLAFLATIFGQFECAQQCFETNGFEVMPPLQNGATDQQPQYLEFISRLAAAVALLPQRSALLFSDIYTYEQSKSRFQVSAPQPALRTFVKKIRPLAAVIRNIRDLPARLKVLSNSAMIRASSRLKLSGSSVEALFLEFGMKEQYLLARRNRIQDGKTRPGPNRASLTKSR
ncbi:MAG: FkbM family methyltransferase [SAR202 cluster bacterium]|nr:FkbM family methyltransferase [SAR202 cluster bacterium]